MHRSTAALAFALLMAAAAPGTTLSNETTADLVVAAERVCCGVVESVDARRDHRSGFVFTHVRVRLLEEMKGAAGAPAIELRLPGGRADGVETVAPGMPRFEVGAEAVLLLGPRNRDGFPPVLQATGGVLPLRADTAGRRCLRVPATGFPELGNAKEVTLDSFRAAVSRVLREEAEKAAEPPPGAGSTGRGAAPGRPSGDTSTGPSATEPPPAAQPGERGEQPEQPGRGGR